MMKFCRCVVFFFFPKQAEVETMKGSTEMTDGTFGLVAFLCSRSECECDGLAVALRYRFMSYYRSIFLLFGAKEKPG